MKDTIYRQEAIMAFDDAGFCSHGYIVDVLKGLPSAQPNEASCWGCNCQKMERLKRQKTFSEMVHLHDSETHDKRTKTHACDLISRKAAIDAVARMIDTGDEDADRYTAEILLEQLPSTQPEVLACGSGKLVQESDGLVKDLVKDCISRQAAIVAVKDALLAWSSMPEWRDDKITEALVELPSAHSERKTGRWKLLYDNIWICTNCEQTEQFGVNIESTSDYCPNCGADMRPTERDSNV